MTTIPELLNLYKKGFKQLFHHRGEKESLSLLKIIFFFCVCLSYIFAFLQFTESNIANIIGDKDWEGGMMADFPLSMFGELAHLMNFLILVGIFYFLLTSDSPLTIKRLKSYHLIAIVISILTIGLVFLTLLLFLIPSPFEPITDISQVIKEISKALSYDVGIVISIVWWMTSPILVLSAILISLDIAAKDYPKLMKGYNIKNVSFFIVFVIVAVMIFGIISTVFNISVLFGERGDLGGTPPIPLEGVQDVYLYELGLYWTSFGIFVALFVFFCLIAFDIIFEKKFGSNEIRERRKANFLFLFPFLLMLVFSKTASATFFFDLELKSLNDAIDILSLFIVIFFAIFRVLSIEEKSQVQQFERKNPFNPIRLLESVPPYCKVLFFFYLAFVSFYATLEANAIVFLSISKIQIEFKRTRMIISVIATFVATIIVFWRYRPYKPFVETTLPNSTNGHLEE